MFKKIIATILSLIIALSGGVLVSSAKSGTSNGETSLQRRSSQIELASHISRGGSVELEEETPRAEAQEAIRNAQRQRIRAQARAVRQGVTFPTDLARQFDDILARAQTAFNGGSFLKAQDLAKGARRGFKAIERRVKRMDRIDNSGRSGSNSGRR